jgi:DNA polymerase (family 10)
MDIQKALELSESVRAAASLHCHRVEVAGSVRRRKQNVKDIEIVARVRDWEGLFGSLTHFGEFIKPGCPDVIPWPPRSGAKYLRMMLHSGVKLDFFVANENNWGALYMMRTGGATGPDGNPFDGFVPAMFSRWKRVSGGGRMRDCLPTLPDGRSVSVPEEEDFFRLVGVDWIPATDRVSSSAVKKQKGYKLDTENLTLVENTK